MRSRSDARWVIAFAVLGIVTGVVAVPAALAAQEAEEDRDPVWGAQFVVPFFSMALPGLGQYLQGAPLSGLAHTGTAVLATVVAATSDADITDVSELPRDGDAQLAFEAGHLIVSAGFLSAWDSFQRSVPLMQAEGKYGFLPTTRESHLDLITAPFDPKYLSRWTTWVHLGYTAALTGWVVQQRESGVAYQPFRGNDAAFVGSLSMNAAVGEEAVFRGWLLPMLTQTTGQRFWVGNSLQAVFFGAGHIEAADDFAAVITAWALYEGWLTRRNDWSLGESIFHHFWYDVAIGVATLLNDEMVRVSFSLPGIR